MSWGVTTFCYVRYKESDIFHISQSSSVQFELICSLQTTNAEKIKMPIKQTSAGTAVLLYTCHIKCIQLPCFNSANSTKHRLLKEVIKGNVQQKGCLNRLFIARNKKQQHLFERAVLKQIEYCDSELQIHHSCELQCLTQTRNIFKKYGRRNVKDSFNDFVVNASGYMDCSCVTKYV